MKQGVFTGSCDQLWNDESNVASVSTQYSTTLYCLLQASKLTTTTYPKEYRQVKSHSREKRSLFYTAFHWCALDDELIVSMDVVVHGNLAVHCAALMQKVVSTEPIPVPNVTALKSRYLGPQRNCLKEPVDYYKGGSGFQFSQHVLGSTTV